LLAATGLRKVTVVPIIQGWGRDAARAVRFGAGPRGGVGPRLVVAIRHGATTGRGYA
jgi:hypothetical protein